MPVQWDSVLTRAVAQELDQRLSGARCRALHLHGPSRTAWVFLDDFLLEIGLDRAAGSVALLDSRPPHEGATSLNAKVLDVSAPPDERRMVVSFLRRRGSARRVDLVVEWAANRRNAILMEVGSGLVVAALPYRGRTSDPVRPGGRYAPPPPPARAGVNGALSHEGFCRLATSARELVAQVAWTSPLNAAAFLTDHEAGWALWRRIARGTEVEPGMLAAPEGGQPYPFPLPDRAFEPAESLLAAFAHLRSGPTTPIDPEALRRMDGLESALGRQAGALRRELASQPRPADLRHVGDLVLARIGQLRRGMSEARLTDFDGGDVTVTLDPTLEPHENADRIYRRASRAERARTTLPEKIADLERRLAELTELRRRLEAGEAGLDDVPEPPLRPPSGPRGALDRAASSKPYRSYRSSGGLEIRVGRGPRANDQLTFHHSRPNDVWLHARDAGGAHVILRWERAESPPARDLEEAAALAALNSRERHSALVAVDWTRRKHVRKPRGSPPGLVAPARVKTLFVSPDPGLPARLTSDSLTTR